MPRKFDLSKSKHSPHKMVMDGLPHSLPAAIVPPQQDPATKYAPDWILASVGAKAGGGSASAAPVSGGGLDWLAQATDPDSVALAATAGVYPNKS